ncbi:MAG: hypothetical protein OXJ52_00430 [Oligoflexia bacterium]|nr:hypothetical protein [Oligoflexia bacterium]
MKITFNCLNFSFFVLLLTALTLAFLSSCNKSVKASPNNNHSQSKNEDIKSTIQLNHSIVRSRLDDIEKKLTSIEKQLNNCSSKYQVSENKQRLDYIRELLSRKFGI